MNFAAANRRLNHLFTAQKDTSSNVEISGSYNRKPDKPHAYRGTPFLADGRTSVERRCENRNHQEGARAKRSKKWAIDEVADNVEEYNKMATIRILYSGYGAFYGLAMYCKMVALVILRKRHNG